MGVSSKATAHKKYKNKRMNQTLVQITAPSPLIIKVLSLLYRILQHPINRIFSKDCRQGLNIKGQLKILQTSILRIVKIKFRIIMKMKLILKIYKWTYPKWTFQQNNCHKTWMIMMRNIIMNWLMNYNTTQTI